MGRPKTYDRDEVLENALLLFWRKGFEGAHLQELVEVTGLNRFSLYKEFGSKEGLFDAAMGRYMERLGSLAACLEAKPLGVVNIRRYFQALVDYRFRHGCFLVNTLSEKHVVGAAIYSKVRSFVRDRWSRDSTADRTGNGRGCIATLHRANTVRALARPRRRACSTSRAIRRRPCASTSACSSPSRVTRA